MTQFAAYERQFRFCRIEAQAAAGAERTFHITRPIAAEVGDDTPLTLILDGAPLKDVRATEFVCEHHDAEGKTILNAAHSDAQKIPVKIGAVDNPDNAATPAKSEKIAELPDLQAWCYADLQTKELVLSLENSGTAPLADVRATLRFPPVYADGVRRIELPGLPAGEKKTWRWPLGEERTESALHDGRPYFVAELDFRAGTEPQRLFATTRLPEALSPQRACFRDAVRMFGPVDQNVDLAPLQKISAADATLDDLAATPDKKWFANSADDHLKLDSECASLYRTDKSWRDAIAPFAVKPKWRFAVTADFTLAQATALKLTVDPRAKAQSIYLNGHLMAAAEKIEGATAGANRIIVVIETADGRGATPLRVRVEPAAGTLEYKTLRP